MPTENEVTSSLGWSTPGTADARKVEWEDNVNTYISPSTTTQARRNREQALQLALQLHHRDEATAELMARAKAILSFLIGDEE